MKTHVAVRFVLLLACGPLLYIADPVPSTAQQSQPALQITSPADGTLVNPGQTITVAVSSPAGLTFTYIAVMGQQPIGTVGANISLPAMLSVAIPSNTSPGKYTIAVAARPSTGPAVFSKAILLSVERPDTPTLLKNDVPAVAFRSPGDLTYLRISGKFPDGSVVNVTESRYLSYSSSNTAVATVSAKGMVRAVGQGKCIVAATYAKGPSQGVAVSVAGGPLTSSPTSLSFGAQNVRAVSSAQSATVTTSTNNASLSISRISAAGDFYETDKGTSSSRRAVWQLLYHQSSLLLAFAPPE